MPASILTHMLLWSALLLPGASFDCFSEHVSSIQASCHSMGTIRVALATIQGWPLEEVPPWTLSEANFEEEESTDNDDYVIVAERCWIVPRLGLLDLTSAIRLDRGFACSSVRSAILRC